LQNGGTALHRAAAKGHADIVEAITNHRECKVNAKDSKGWSALAFAAFHGHTKCVEVLCARPTVDVMIHGPENKTPLELAQRNKHNSVIAILNAVLQDRPTPGGDEEDEGKGRPPSESMDISQSGAWASFPKNQRRRDRL
jgi:ankyrin repeat protein